MHSNVKTYDSPESLSKGWEQYRKGQFDMLIMMYQQGQISYDHVIKQFYCLDRAGGKDE